MRALAVFLFPVLELYLLVRAGAFLGAMGVVAWVFASAALGITALRLHGRQNFFQVRNDLSAGRMPQDILLDNLLVFFAGVLLIFPGFLSDIMGVLLLIPWLRDLFRSRLVAWLKPRQSSEGAFRNGSVFIYRNGDFPQSADPEDNKVIDVSAEPTQDSDHSDAASDKKDAGSPEDDRR